MRSGGREMVTAYPDPDEVERINRDILKQNGYLFTTRGGDEREDRDQLIDDVYVYFKDNCVATSKGEITKLALIKGELYDTIFTRGPRWGSGSDINETTVIARLATRLWGIASPSMDSPCNLRAAA